ncbi:MAG: alanine racemase, partial [Burkholderiales bacterium]
AGAVWFGVADAAEGVAVRAALQAKGLDGARVLLMSGLLDEEADAIVEHRLTPIVWTVEQIECVAAAARRRRAGPVSVHLAVETGMARQGAALRDLGPVLDCLRHRGDEQSVTLEGVMTHFAAAEVAGSALTREQRKRFEQALQRVNAVGLRPHLVHAGNSSMVDNDAAEGALCWLREAAASVGARPMTRAGIGLYGYCLPIDSGTAHAAHSLVRDRLQPVMTWKARVIALRDVQAGETVGYNATFTAARPMRLALLPVGYADGLRRELSSTNERAGGWVMLGGQRAAIIGRVSMNLTVVDVTEIPDAHVGDEAVVLGDGVTADDHARLAGTISYEILCGVRVRPRVLGAG